MADPWGSSLADYPKEKLPQTGPCIWDFIFLSRQLRNVIREKACAGRAVFPRMIFLDRRSRSFSTGLVPNPTGKANRRKNRIGERPLDRQMERRGK